MGKLLRYLLNINTVWGLMILISFVLCLVQQYLPSTTVIPTAQVRPGANTLTVRVQPPSGKVESFDLPLVERGGELSIPPDTEPRAKDRPWLISVRQERWGYVLKWDKEGNGKYEVAMNGTLIGRGSLVNLQSITDAAFEYAKKGFDIAWGLVAAMVLFLGLMKVGEDAGLVQLIARAFHPLIRFIFPGVPKDHPANGILLLNMTSGVLGLANAVTPFGLKAMKELQTLNKHPEIATDAQVMLLCWNTGGLQLLPAMLLAVRKSAGCRDPFEVIGTCLIAGAVCTMVSITMAKLLARLPLFTVRAALAEDAASGVSEDREPAAAGAMPIPATAAANAKEGRE
jgi:spore maturation protein A